jgi:acetyl esterase/lipase
VANFRDDASDCGAARDIAALFCAPIRVHMVRFSHAFSHPRHVPITNHPRPHITFTLRIALSATVCFRIMQARIRLISLWCIALAMLPMRALLADNVPPATQPAAIRPPAQPADGPGGAKTAHDSVIRHSYGQGGTQYWIYEPDAPKPDSAPVVIFIHGWGAWNPAIYGAWIDHIVKRGNIVIFPKYQATLVTSPRDFTSNAISSIQDALKQLQSEPDHVKPQMDHWAAVGHSVGGLLVANVAALAAESGLPQIKAVMSTEPGKTSNASGQTFVGLADMKKIPATTLLLAVAGDKDRLVGKIDALRIFRESTSVAPQNKNFVVVQSDSHGTPPLVANHLAPVAPDLAYNTASTTVAAAHPALRNPSLMIDALDYYGFWKLFDGLSDAAFYGTDREYALGNTPQQRDMGKWSDGTTVRELEVTLGSAENEQEKK